MNVGWDVPQAPVVYEIVPWRREAYGAEIAGVLISKGEVGERSFKYIYRK